VERVKERHRVAAGPVRARRLRVCGAVAVVVAAVLIACASTNAGDTPRGQLRYWVESSNRARVLSLFTTERGERNDYEFSWFVSSLPCAVGPYSLLDTAAAIASSQASSEEAQMRLLSARPPRGVRCGTRLTSQPGETLTITIKPGSRSVEAVTPLLYSGDGVKIESFTPCVSFNGLCAGRFTMTVILESPRRRLTFVYRFRIFYVKSSGRYEGPGRGSTNRMAQCRIG
jgi:hypothetical protein